MLVVVAPGGGHSQTCDGARGYDIAECVNKNGIAAFVLKYRLQAKDSHYTVTGNALPDAARAMRMVRSGRKNGMWIRRASDSWASRGRECGRDRDPSLTKANDS